MGVVGKGEGLALECRLDGQRTDIGPEIEAFVTASGRPTGCLAGSYLCPWRGPLSRDLFMGVTPGPINCQQ